MAAEGAFLADRSRILSGQLPLAFAKARWH